MLSQRSTILACAAVFAAGFAVMTEPGHSGPSLDEAPVKLTDRHPAYGGAEVDLGAASAEPAPIRPLKDDRLDHLPIEECDSARAVCIVASNGVRAGDRDPTVAVVQKFAEATTIAVRVPRTVTAQR